MGINMNTIQLSSHRHIKLFMLILFSLTILIATLSSCTLTNASGDKKLQDLDFTVVQNEDIPEALRKIIEEKKETPFKLTYSNDDSLYIVVGYGKQNTGGYSIEVPTLYLTESSIIVDTNLLGPESQAAAQPSYPYIVIKTEYRDNPVVFQ